MLTISFPNTPAMRELLGQLTGHVHDDDIPFHEDEVLEGKPENAAMHRALAEAGAAFVEIVTLALHPELRS